jgi:hypothetical protein
VTVLSAPLVSLAATGWLKDIDVLGFYVPPIAAWALLALVPFLLFRWLLLISGLYRFVWHRALFNLALYLLILSGIVLGGGQGWL